MIRGIKFVGIPVRNQDAALKFYTEKLGFKVVTDQPMTDRQRWIELMIPGAESGLALFTPEGHERRIGRRGRPVALPRADGGASAERRSLGQGDCRHTDAGCAICSGSCSSSSPAPSRWRPVFARKTSSSVGSWICSWERTIPSASPS